MSAPGPYRLQEDGEPTPRRRRPKRCTLTDAPVLDADATYLIFECHRDSIALYRGRRVTVVNGGRVYDLGAVQDDGIAELRVDEALDAAHSAVHIDWPGTDS